MAFAIRTKWPGKAATAGYRRVGEATGIGYCTHSVPILACAPVVAKPDTEGFRAATSPLSRFIAIGFGTGTSETNVGWSRSRALTRTV